MIPEIWYEMLRFIGRYSEDFEWRWSEAARAWWYCELGEWNIAYQARPARMILLSVVEEVLRYTVQDLVVIYFQEAIMRSDPRYAV